MLLQAVAGGWVERAGAGDAGSLALLGGGTDQALLPLDGRGGLGASRGVAGRRGPDTPAEPAGLAPAAGRPAAFVAPLLSPDVPALSALAASFPL